MRKLQMSFISVAEMFKQADGNYSVSVLPDVHLVAGYNAIAFPEGGEAHQKIKEYLESKGVDTSSGVFYPFPADP